MTATKVVRLGKLIAVAYSLVYILKPVLPGWFVNKNRCIGVPLVSG